MNRHDDLPAKVRRFAARVLSSLADRPGVPVRHMRGAVAFKRPAAKVYDTFAVVPYELATPTPILRVAVNHFRGGPSAAGFARLGLDPSATWGGQLGDRLELSLLPAELVAFAPWVADWLRCRATGFPIITTPQPSPVERCCAGVAGPGHSYLWTVDAGRMYDGWWRATGGGRRAGAYWPAARAAKAGVA